MDFAIVKLFGKQHLVNEDSNIVVQAPVDPSLKNIPVEEVLLISRDGSVEIGTPTLPNIKLTAAVVSTGKGDKLYIQKFKAKSRYRRRMGFRPFETVLKISDFESKKEVQKETTKKTKKTK